VLGGPILSPDKLAVIAALSSEMIAGSNAELLVRDALSQSAALALDTVLLDANASTAARPAGLRYNIAALTASALTDRTEAMLADIATVAGGVAPVAGNAPITLVANPVRAMTLRLRAPRELPVSILASFAIANDDDYDVLADGAVVGRIFKANASRVGASWMWTLAFWHYEDRTPTHGYAATREAAMRAFARSWRRE
jgi:hypothetical protein